MCQKFSFVLVFYFFQAVEELYITKIWRNGELLGVEQLIFATQRPWQASSSLPAADQDTHSNVTTNDIASFEQLSPSMPL